MRNVIIFGSYFFSLSTFSLFHSSTTLTQYRSQSIKIGYALCFYSYSTWQGRTLFLEDLYVKPAYRTQGVGRMLFTHATRFAKETGCLRMDFHVLEWNPARKFYEKIGAVDLTVAEDWHFYRMTSDAIDALCSRDA